MKKPNKKVASALSNEKKAALSILTFVLFFGIGLVTLGPVDLGDEQLAAAAASTKAPCKNDKYYQQRSVCFKETKFCGLRMNVSMVNGKPVSKPAGGCTRKAEDKAVSYDNNKSVSNSSTSWLCGISGFESYCNAGTSGSSSSGSSNSNSSNSGSTGGTSNAPANIGSSPALYIPQ